MRVCAQQAFVDHGSIVGAQSFKIFSARNQNKATLNRNGVVNHIAVCRLHSKKHRFVASYGFSDIPCGNSLCRVSLCVQGSQVMKVTGKACGELLSPL